MQRRIKQKPDLYNAEENEVMVENKENTYE